MTHTPQLTPQVLRPIITRALQEDGAAHDLTSRALIPPQARIRAHVIAKAPGVLAGVKLAALVFTTLDRSVRCRVHLHTGDAVKPGAEILTLEGRARSIFAAERVALNFLGHLSGIATLTASYVRRIGGTRAKILDTRKTLPGLRALEKYAVRAGGGHNHRTNLGDAILIKTNHLKVLHRAGWQGSQAIQQAIKGADDRASGKWIEIEAASLAEVEAALVMRPDAVLLDNMTVAQARQAVRLRGRRTRTLLEVSGGVTLANVRAYAKAGVDRISIGRLTHSAPSLDVSLTVE